METCCLIIDRKNATREIMAVNPYYIIPCERFVLL